jgi:hypothetical protein
MPRPSQNPPQPVILSEAKNRVGFSIL